MDLNLELILIPREKIKELPEEAIDYVIEKFNEYNNLELQKFPIKVLKYGQVDVIGMSETIYINDDLDIVLKFEAYNEKYYNDFKQYNYEIVKLSFGEIHKSIYTELKYCHSSGFGFVPCTFDIVLKQNGFREDKYLFEPGRSLYNKDSRIVEGEKFEEVEKIVTSACASIYIVERDGVEYLSLEDEYRDECKLITSDIEVIEKFREIRERLTIKELV